MTQIEIADAIGTTPTSVGRWEAGLVMPKDAMLVKLAKYFGVTPAWLRYGSLPREYPKPTEEMPPLDPSIRPMTERDAVELEERIHGKKVAKKRGRG